MKTRTILKWASAPLLMSGFLLANAAQSQAAVSCVVSIQGTPPTAVTVNQPFSGSFTVDVSGKPNANHECEIDNLRYAWEIHIKGSDGGIAIHHGSGSSASFSHVANDKCQNYTVTAYCTVTFDTSTECEVEGDKDYESGSAAFSVSVSGTQCQNL